ncbi:MAG TPA: response regulator [Dyella sp.]|uniref:response regulator n=1 Tax=Dyella sp. TaxID=1869338 RepID=UPI002C690EDE|nr:response regulator [Dyella sp.]HUB90291.1 response regulator [Dyella sp.]
MTRVLLVEDDPDVAAACRAMLEHLGCFVLLANDGRQGLELIMSMHPDIVITDVMMPVMSGFEMIERARAMQYEGPIVVCSAIPEQDHRNHHARYDAFLQKPYRLKDLAMILAKF